MFYKDQNMSFFIGLDLGQKQDYTAIAIIETASQYTGLDWRSYEHKYFNYVNVRHLERIRLGTSYLAVVERLRQIVNSRELMNMRIKVSVAGHDSYAAARASNHDDLVLAVALACWRAKGNLSRPVFGTRSLGLDY